MRELNTRTPLGIWIANHVSHDGDECIPWPFALQSAGYPMFGRSGMGTSLAHRVMCELKNGHPPSPSHDAAHLCGNRACMNPKHLSWKTRKENEADKLHHGTWKRTGNAKLTEAQVLEIKAAKGLNQKELAAKFGVSESNISRVQGGAWKWLD